MDDGGQRGDPVSGEAFRPCCQIGGWPDVERVNAELRNGLSVRQAAKRFKTTRAAIEKHRACLGLKGRPEPVDDEPLPPFVEGEPQTPRRHPADMQSEFVSTADSEPDSSQMHGMGQDGADLGRAPVPATMAKDPMSLFSFEDRAGYIADLATRGRWYGRRTARRLAAVWGVSLDLVTRYAKAAGFALRVDRETLEVQREHSVAQLERIRRKAEQGEDYRGAVAARTEADKILGLHPSHAPAVQINLQAPQMVSFMGAMGQIVRRAFPEIPDAAERLHRAMRDYIDGGEDAAPPMLDVSADSG